MQKQVLVILAFLAFFSLPAYALEDVSCLQLQNKRYKQGFTIYKFQNECGVARSYSGGQTYLNYSKKNWNKLTVSTQADLKISVNGVGPVYASSYTKNSSSRSITITWPNSAPDIPVNAEVEIGVKSTSKAGDKNNKRKQYLPAELSCTTIATLDFGTLAADDSTSPAIFSLNKSTSLVTPLANVSTLSNAQRGEIQVTGEPGRTISLTFPGAVILNNAPESGTINATLDANNSCLLNSSGQCDVYVGVSSATLSSGHDGGVYNGTLHYSCSY